jgi:hypothetical protein
LARSCSRAAPEEPERETTGQIVRQRVGEKRIGSLLALSLCVRERGMCARRREEERLCV